MWEYNVAIEIKDGENRMEYKAFNIISPDSPETGWAIIFSLLSKRGDLKDVTRINNCSAFQKEMTFLER